jgi:deoxyribose-phosphate aldolase
VGAITLRPSDLDQALRFLDGSGIRVGSTAGYPDGTSTTAAKLYEGRDLIRRGAKEIEMTVNVGKLISRQFQYVETELMQMARSCLESGVAFKVSLGRFALPDDLKIIAIRIAKRIEAAYFSLPYTEANMGLLQPLLKERILLRGAGGITTLEAALAARDSGCSRLATAQSSAILTRWKQHLEALAKERTQNDPASPRPSVVS